MARRIEIEITSLQGETATWRAAGAKLPKGTLATSLLPSGVAVGTQFRADVEQTMESIEILAVLPVKTASPVDPRNERIEIVPKAPTGPDVQVIYAAKGRRGRDDEGRERRSGSKRPDGARGPRGPRPDGERGERPARSGAPRGRDGGRREARPVGPPMTTTHRNAFLATLTPEQLPVAEQLLRGGLPAVRAAVAEQNQAAASQGRATVNAEAIDRIANELLGKTNLAMWKDRAAGAQGAGRELRLRDLRAVVTSAKTVILDDEGRTVLKELQTQLTARIEQLTTEWTEKIAKAIEGNNALDALTLTARPPEFRMQVASETAQKIAQMASDALRSDVSPAQWIELLQAAVASPMHRSIKPTGIPADDACKSEAIKVAGVIPELAKLLGMKVPPPPPPARPATRRPRPTTRS